MEYYGYYNNLSDLEQLILEKQPAVLAIQETHKALASTMDNTLSKKKYKWISKCCTNYYHSVALGIAVELPFTSITLSTDLPVVAARITYPLPVSVVSFYIPNQKFPDLKLLLQNVIDKIPEPMILLGDGNGHHQNWGSRSDNLRGVTLVEIANQNGLTILNDGSITFVRGQQESAIDITLASTTIVNRLLWSADLDPLGSDHIPFTISLNDKPPTTLALRTSMSPNQGSIETALEISSPTTITEFSEAIYDVALSTIPKTSSTPGRRALPWWSEETKKKL